MRLKYLHRLYFNYNALQQIKRIDSLHISKCTVGLGKLTCGAYRGYSVEKRESNEDDRHIPRRVLKRLKLHGLTEEHVIKATKTSKKSQQKEGAVDEIKHLIDSMVVGDAADSEHSFPSDRQDQTRLAVRRRIDPLETSLVLFPGQGSQFVGMGSKLLDYEGVKKLYEISSDILGYDLLDVCLNGPKSKLDKTVICQPAVFVTSIAGLDKLQAEYPQVVDNCTGTAGFSVGEYSALVYSGMLSFTDALKVVKVRAEAMQEASELIPSGMMTVFIGHDTKLNFAMLAAREYCCKKLDIENPVCSIANYLYSDCKVISGNEEALQFIEDNRKEFGIRRTKRLPVSGAFHSNLMHSACEPVIKILNSVEIKKPLFRVHSNVTTQRYHGSRQLVNLLNQQITKPVKWEQTLHMLYSRKQGEHFPQTFEVGPGNQMGTLLKMVNVKAYNNYTQIEV